MSNSLLTDSVITKECLMELKNQLAFTRSVNRQYDGQFAQSGAKKGDTINIRTPSRYEVTDSATLVIQDSADKSVALQLDTQSHVGLAFSNKDRALSVDDFKERYIKSAMTALANKVDYNGYLAMYKSIYNSVGVPSASALPSTLKGFTQAYAKLANCGAPLDELVGIIDPNVQSSLVNGLSSLFQSSEQIKNQYEKGVMGMAAGMKFKMSQNVVKHTAGAPVGTPAIKTSIAAEGAAAIELDGITGSITACYKVGDVIQIGGVYAVNPQTKQSTGELMQFVVTATTNSVSNEIAALPISPAMYLTGAYQNISAYPLDNAAVTLFGAATTYASVVAPQNLVFHPDAFVLGTADLFLPPGATLANDKDAGLSLRMWSQGDITNDRMITRVDVLYGWKCVRPEFGCRVVGQPA